jgi:hypothetical protein
MSAVRVKKSKEPGFTCHQRMSGFADVPVSLCMFHTTNPVVPFTSVKGCLPTASAEDISRIYNSFKELAGFCADVERQVLVRKRRIKTAEDVSSLNQVQMSVFTRYLFLYKQNRGAFLSSVRNTSKRTINFFVVVYAKLYPVRYFLDKSCEPYKIVGGIGGKLSDVPKDIQNSVEYVDLFAHYKDSKEKQLRRVCGMSPYARSTVVASEEHTFPLSKMQFDWWFWNVAGHEAFRILEIHVRKCKLDSEKKKQFK